MPELTAEEQAYFASGGEKAPAEEVAATETPAEQGETVSADTGQAEPVEQAAEGAESAQDGEKADHPRDDKGKFVPHGALHEEREKRKAAEARAQRIEEQVLQRLIALQEKPASPAQPETTRIPSVDAGDDPLDVIRWQQQQIAALQASRQEDVQQREHQTEQQREAARIRDHVATQVDAFKAEHPDYGDAYNFAVETRVNELRMLGATNSEIQAAVQADEESIVRRALQQGRNPADLLYQYAAARGYKKADAVDPAKAAADKIATVEKGQQQNRSLGQAAGTGLDKMTLETLAGLSDDEFAKACESGTFRKLMGG